MDDLRGNPPLRAQWKYVPVANVLHAGPRLSIQQHVQPRLRFENTGKLTRRGTLCSCVSVSGDHVEPGP